MDTCLVTSLNFLFDSINWLKKLPKCGYSHTGPGLPDKKLCYLKTVIVTADMKPISKRITGQISACDYKLSLLEAYVSVKQSLNTYYFY